MGLKPEYRLLANQSDITDIIRDRLISLSFTDEAGMESDVLEIVLADTDPDKPIQVPPTGAELELFLGFDGAATRMGLFIVDEIELSGWPGEMSISAKAAPFDKSKGGKANLQTQKTRSWAKGTKLGALVQKIGSEHGMQGRAAGSLASIALPALHQSDESDMHFLVRLARMYDAVVKPAGGQLLLAKRGETKTASGGQMPTVTVEPGDVSGFKMKQARREDSGTVVAAYHVTRTAKRHTVKVGSGEPVRRLRMQYGTEAQAKAAAVSELDRRKRAATTLSFSMPGRPDVAAEAPLKLKGFRVGIATEWIITRVAHTLDKSGYEVTVEAETPNADGQKNVTEEQE